MLAAVVALLASFHFWGEAGREREWWWVGGDSDGMLFIDLLDTRSGRGHMLSTFVNPGDDGAPAHEFELEWSCAPPAISWRDMWTLDRKMLQIERSASSRDLAKEHPPTGAQEQLLFDIACRDKAARSKMRTFRVERNPIEVTEIATALVAEGIEPFGALMLAGYAPDRDEMMYERLLTKYVPREKLARIRELAGAPE